MITKIDLCSMALLKLGEKPIQSLNDDSASASMARTLFEPISDALLAMYPWRFARKRIELSKTTDGDFLIPADVLRVIKCDGEIIGNKISARDEHLTIDAIVRAAPETFPGYFASLCATKLAMEFCIPLSGDQNVFRMLAALYESELTTAKFIDGASNKNDGITEFSLLSARF